jgi:CBS domain-containing protein
MRRLVAKDVMNPEVLTVREDMTVQEVATILVENEISGAPVEDAQGHLVGVVSLTDIAMTAADSAGIEPDRTNPDYFVRGWEEKFSPDEMLKEGLHVEAESVSVREIMTPALYSVPDETPVAQIAEMMIDGHVHRLLVTRNKQVVGIITTSDLLGLLVEEPTR